MNLDPVVLAGPSVRLEPLSRTHAADLLTAASHDEVWTYLDEPTTRTVEDMWRMTDEALHEQQDGSRLPFAIIESATSRAVGSVSYINISHAHRSLEIGWAWLAPDVWGQGIFGEAGYLLLRHALEYLGAVRVSFKADIRNLQSQRAIVKLGATCDGVFRNHRILSDGHKRDSVYFSVIDSDWPSVHEQLKHRLGR
ncbi:MAG TPA: GNAT family N-acetyltransferase [Micromonosporaceae bacterium]